MVTPQSDIWEGNEMVDGEAVIRHYDVLHDQTEHFLRGRKTRVD